MAISECLVHSSLQADSQVKFALQLGLQVGGHLMPAHVHSSDPSELSYINIVLLLLLLFLLLLLLHQHIM